MKWSLFIGRISGIKIFIHWSFLLLILWIVLSGARRGNSLNEILFSLGLIAAIFVCITLHELGHAITAKRFRFKTNDITLLPIGGVARMEGFPDKPMQELLVAIMGPAVNVAISVILFFGLKITDTFPKSINNIQPSEISFWFQLFAINIFLALFNLIPAFPMDGGRVLRALLATRLPRVRATRIAAFVGQLIATAFVLVGIFYNPFLVFIGFFVFAGATIEASAEEAKSLLADIHVGDVLMTQFSILQSNAPLSGAVSLMLDSQDKAFVIKDDGTVTGTLSKTEIINGLSKFGKDVPIERVMQKEIIHLHKEDKVNEIMQKFSDGSYSLMPVLEGEKVIGVLNLDNIREFIEIESAINKQEKVLDTEKEIE